MRVQKLYRDIVIIGAAMLLFVYVKGRFDLWQMEQKPYGVLIQSQSELTGVVVSEFANFLGIRQFLPFSSTEVTLKLGEYSMLPTDLIEALPEVLREWTQNGL